MSVVTGRCEPVDASERLTLTTTAGEAVVGAVGDLDLSADPAFRACLDHALDDPGCRMLIVDLRRVSFLGARGVGTLGRAHDRAHRRDVRFLVVADTRPVLRALSAAGADGIEIVATPAAARCSGWSR